jgi:Cytochrome P460
LLKTKPLAVPSLSQRDHLRTGFSYVKDSRKYASTGGWGFAQFNDGKPADAAVHKTCFACHQAVQARDFVFTRYAP